MGGETMPQRMGGDGLADPGSPARRPAGVLQGASAHMSAWLLAREQPEAWPRSPPIGAKDLQEPRRQHGVAVLAAFARLDVNQHPRAVDRADLQTRDLADP